MKNFLISIAGGSGCGKSTLAYGLQELYPHLIEVVHFDDYQKKAADIELMEGIPNWDHPRAIEFDQLYTDLKKLISGKNVTIMTKSKAINPAYNKDGRITHLMKSKKIIIIEGYMVLLDERIRDLSNLKIYLDLPFEVSSQRRDKMAYHDEEKYNKTILKPQVEEPQRIPLPKTMIIYPL